MLTPLKRRSVLAGIGLFTAAAVAAPLIPAALAQSKVALSGAGATFPAPAYQTWFASLNKKNPNLEVSYQPVGSGAGVTQFIAGTVDFGASDSAMKPDEIAKVKKGAVILPMTAGMVAVAYNAPGYNAKLSRKQLADIFLGKIKNWKDVGGPNRAVTVIYRSDGSGTTDTFTKHLSAISPEWKSKVGAGKSVSWPTGTAGKGNAGVSALIKQTAGSIGYVDFADAKQSKLQMATLQNKAGKFIAPSAASGSAALSEIKLDSNLIGFDSDPDGANAYPIVTYTWIMAYANYGNAAKANGVKAMLNYGLSPEAQKAAANLGYVPLPNNVVTRVKAAVNKIK